MTTPPNELYAALEPFLNTNEPAHMRQLIAQHPQLLEPQAAALVQQIIDGYEGDAEMLEYLKSRYAMLQAMREYGPDKVLDMFEEHLRLVEHTETLQMYLNTYGVEPLRAVLTEHPELLEPHMDALIDQVVQKYADQPQVLQHIDAKREILNEVRSKGIEPFFDEFERQEPQMHQRLLLQEFLSADHASEEHDLLSQHPELLDPAYDALFDQLYQEYADDEQALATLHFNQAQLQAYRQHGVEAIYAAAQGFEQAYGAYREAWHQAQETDDVETWQAAAEAGKPLLDQQFQVLPAVRQTTLRQHLADTFNNLAVAQYTAGEPETAALTHRRVLELRPNYAPAWRHHARLMIELGDQEAARLALDHARKLDPQAEELEELERINNKEHRS